MYSLTAVQNLPIPKLFVSLRYSCYSFSDHILQGIFTRHSNSSLYCLKIIKIREAVEILISIRLLYIIIQTDVSENTGFLDGLCKRVS